MENINNENKTREEIRSQRQAKRREKRMAKNEQKKITNVNVQGSEKLTIINAETMKKYEINKTSPKISRFNRKKFTKTINFADFIVDRRIKTKANVRVKKLKQTTFCINSNNFNRLRGKRREFRLKKKNTKLKKRIIATRLSKRKKREEELADDGVSINVGTQQNNTTMETLSIGLSEIKILDSADESDKLQPENNSHTRYIYSRKFRTYCDNLTSPDLCKLTESLLGDIFRFQRRAYENNENKARAHRRYVIGLKEVKSYLSVNKLKLIIIAPDCEICEELDEIINEIKNECQKRKVSYIFSLKRHQLRNVLHKNTPISCVGILNYDGAQDTFHELTKALTEERLKFQMYFK